MPVYSHLFKVVPEWEESEPIGDEQWEALLKVQEDFPEDWTGPDLSEEEWMYDLFEPNGYAPFPLDALPAIMRSTMARLYCNIFVRKLTC